MQFSKNNLFYYKLRITSSATSLISLIYISIIRSFVPCFLVLLASSEHIILKDSYDLSKLIRRHKPYFA